MDSTDYPFEVNEWLRKTKPDKQQPADFIGDHPYRHFDGRVTHEVLDTSSSKLLPILQDPLLLAKHSFLPFIRKDKKVRRYTRDHTTKKVVVGQKVRPIMYACHRDASIYAFYSFLLKNAYEKRIAGTALEESVIAYRHVKRDDNAVRGKSNIDFAKDVHNLVTKHPRCAVLCLDISKFFDSMDHGLIKAKWTDLLNTKDLPIGHYAVYRSIIKYRYVFLYEALIALGYGKIKDGKFEYKKGKAKTGILCSPLIFRKKIDAKIGSLVHKNRSKKGIPQGSPISDIIANLYMEDFDRAVLSALSAYTFGYYRRYSDDILIICPEDKMQEMYKYARDQIKTDLLVIKAEKSEAVVVDNNKKIVEDITYTVTGELKHQSYSREAFQYLGFEIDAKDMHIRSGTIANHYRRALRRAKAELNAAAKSKTVTLPIQGKKKSNRSRWQYFINTERRTGSARVKRQHRKAFKRVRSFSAKKP